MHEEDRIWDLVARKLAGEATTEELKELEELLKKHPEISYPSDLLSEFWQQKEPDNTTAAEEAFSHHLDKWAQKKADLTYEKQKTEQLTAKDRTKKTWLFYSIFNTNGIINHYLKTTWRGLMRSKSFSFINILGLAIGMASAILILLWIKTQWSTDRTYPKTDRIYVALSRGKVGDNTAVFGGSPHALANTLKKDFSNYVDDVTRTAWVAVFILKNAEKKAQTQGLMVDSGFLNIFDFPLKKGDPKTALTTPRGIVISEGLAEKLFPGEDAFGKIINIDSNVLFTVTGITKDLPANTSFSFDYLMNWSYMKDVGWENLDWGVNNTLTYILLKEGVNKDQASMAFRDLRKQHDKTLKDEFFLHNLGDWWLADYDKQGNLIESRLKKDLKLFGTIAVFILLIACINYMNLSTARSEKRAREVGIRKVIGAQKISLIARFLGESILISLMAGVLALVIVYFALPGFNKLVNLPGFNVYTHKLIVIPFSSLNFWLSAVGFIVLTGILAGSYPAFYLSAYKPISVLQKTYKRAKSIFTPRKILVIIQFSFAIVMIIGSIIIYRQILYGQTRDPGYKQENLAFVYLKGDMLKKYDSMKSELFSRKIVTDMIRTNSPVTDVWVDDDDYAWRGKDTSTRVYFDMFTAEDRFLEFHGFNLAEGRDFDMAKNPSDSLAIILTESAVKSMGFDHPIGEKIIHKKKEWHVVGVIKDFIPEFPYSPAWPTVIHRSDSGVGIINMKLNPALSKEEAKKQVVDIFQKYNPEYVVEYRLIADEYANKFTDEIHMGWLAALFGGLTIFISCMGLFALAAYTAENRIKEIGIRKVLGASVTRITTLLSKDFLKLVIISFLIASPVAWWFMNKWLSNYTYHVSISWWIFALTGFIAILIAAVTVSYQSIKAALANPVDSLRSE